MAREIKVGIGYDSDIAYFTMKAITLAEDEDFAAKFVETQELSGKAKSEAETAIYIDAIEEWTVKPLERKVGDKFEPYFADKVKGDDRSDVRKFFESGDFDTERVASQLLYAYRSKLQPTVVFQ